MTHVERGVGKERPKMDRSEDGAFGKFEDLLNVDAQ
jgi:hypothetical protein